MTITIPDGGAFVADTADETYVLAAIDAIGAASGVDGIDASASLGGRIFQLDGTVVVSGGASALSIDNDSSADPDKVFIGRSGRLQPNLFGGGASGGLEAFGGTVEVENAGIISSGKEAIRAELETFALKNLGLITGSGVAAVFCRSESTTITNSGTIIALTANAIDVKGNFEIENSGLIESGDENGIQVGHTTAATGTIVNLGTITGGEKAILADTEASDIQVVNRGNVVGNIDLSAAGGNSKVDTAGGVIGGSIVTGAGDDILILRDSTILGVADGGDGDDIYIVDAGSVAIVEASGEGTDTVKSFVDFSLVSLDDVENITLLGKQNTDATGNALANVLVGNKGGNAIDGGDGNDTIRGAKGNDVLAGGADEDTFVFRAGDGKDRITDFAAADDILDLSAVASITSFKDLTKNHVAESGGDLVIDAGGGATIRIENLSAADLDEALFLF